MVSDDHSARADYALEIIDYANFVAFSDASSLKFQLSCDSYEISQIYKMSRSIIHAGKYSYGYRGEVPRNYLTAV